LAIAGRKKYGLLPNHLERQAAGSGTGHGNGTTPKSRKSQNISQLYPLRWDFLRANKKKKRKGAAKKQRGKRASVAR